MQWQPISVTCLRNFSRSLLVSFTQAVVTGTTSRGVFIRFSTDWVLFLSFETFHGPLTLNLSGGETTLRSLEVNDKIVIQDEKILIPSSGIEIDFSQAATWETPPRLKTFGGTIAHLLMRSMYHRAQVMYLMEKVGLEGHVEGDVLSWEASSFG